jgi:hypothetical protein
MIGSPFAFKIAAVSFSFRVADALMDFPIRLKLIVLPL